MQKGNTMARKKEMDNLAKDAAAALAAGMSYGKWKAMQGYTEVKKADEIPKGWRACKVCGKIFKPTNKQIYCEYACQKTAQKEQIKAYKQRNKGKEREEKNESNT